MEKVIVNQETKFGAEELSPDFAPDIVVKFANDISAPEYESLKKLVEDGKNEEFAAMLFKIMVLDWNIFIDEETKLEITAENIDSKLSKRLSNWIGGKASELFFVIVNGSTQNTAESQAKP